MRKLSTKMLDIEKVYSGRLNSSLSSARRSRLAEFSLLDARWRVEKKLIGQKVSEIVKWTDRTNNNDIKRKHPQLQDSKQAKSFREQ